MNNIPKSNIHKLHVNNLVLTVQICETPLYSLLYKEAI